jgi:hypothetical protein
LNRGNQAGSSTSYTKLNKVGASQLVYSRLKAFEGAITVTPQAMEPAFASAEFPTFDLESSVDEGYMRFVTTRQELWESMAQRSKGMGGRRERLHPRDLLQIPFTPPSRAEQASIAAVATAIQASEGSAQVTADTLREVRARLLTLLLSGTHEIPDSYDRFLAEGIA